MKQSKLLSLALILGLILLLNACTKKPVMNAEPAPAPAVSEAPTAPAPTVPAAETSSATMTTLTGSQLETVYFDYDSHTLSPVARQTLERNAGLLRQEAGLAVIVEGHCDERGSDEYNLALGELRATTVKGYLVTLGVAAERLKAISYGEERPAVSGNDEAAWAKNRRAAFN